MPDPPPPLQTDVVVCCDKNDENCHWPDESLSCGADEVLWCQAASEDEAGVVTCHYD
jgi:hypothetical protein